MSYLTGALPLRTPYHGLRAMATADRSFSSGLFGRNTSRRTSYRDYGPRKRQHWEGHQTCSYVFPRLYLSSSSSSATTSSISSSAPTSTRDKSLPQPLTQLMDGKIALGEFKSDPIQRRATQKLERLQKALTGYSNQYFIHSYLQRMKHHEHDQQSTTTDGINTTVCRDALSMISHESDSTQEATLIKHTDKSGKNQEIPRVPRGLYIHGPVGIGKSMLMDVFFENVQVGRHNKRRFHFHAFMAEVHQRIHHLKRQQLEEEGRNFSVDTNPQNNPIHRVGIQLAQELSLLCLDEFQVTDIADALILTQLFTTLWSMGMVVVATSNRLPSQLYEGGLNRAYFLPFVDLLQKHCIVHGMQSEIDYRIALTSDFFLDSFFFDGSTVHGGKSFEETIQKLRLANRLFPSYWMLVIEEN